MPSFVVTVQTESEVPVEGLYLEVLDGDKNSLAYVGPSDADGYIYGSVAELGSYFLALIGTHRFSTVGFTSLDLSTNAYHSVTFTVYPYVSGDSSLPTLAHKVDLLSQKISILASKQKGLLTEAKQEEIEEYVMSKAAEIQTSKLEVLGKLREAIDALNRVMDQYSKPNWEDAVETEALLPVADRSYTVRVVLEPEVGDDPALFIKLPSPTGWTRFS